MAVFMIATIIIFSAVAVPNLIIQGRREREEEMVWRGEQYERAIGLYFRKVGRYPAKVEDLTRQTNGVRFLRQAYTDPMNKGDGSWRFIYVGPNGQLIGSLRRTSLLQSLMATPTLPGATPAATLAQQNANPGGPPGAGALGAGAAANPLSPATTPNPQESQPQPLTGAVMGGNIIGVGSKVKQSSLRVYQGGDSYEQWEFIWNPVGQIAIPGPAPSAPGQGGAPGAPPPMQPTDIQQTPLQIPTPPT